MNALPASGRVAVIAVHGVADQRLGETGAAVASQLAAAGGAQVQVAMLPLPVPALDPAVSYQRWSPPGLGGRILKSLRQSWRSDFLDGAIGGTPTAGRQRNSAIAEAPAADTGVRFTDYLLAKAQRARQPGPAEPALVPVHAVDGPGLQADVFEMYWADLSRLPGSLTRIVAELFTLLFHLSRLGVEALSLAERLHGGTALRTVAALQRCADWFYLRLLAPLALQLLLCALLLAPAQAVHEHRAGAQALASALVAVGAAVWVVYRWHGPWRLALPSGLLAGALGWVVFGGDQGFLALMLAWSLGLALLLLRFLAYAEQRFRALYGIGLLMSAGTFCALLWFGRRAGLGNVDGWLDGGLGALEAVLLAHALLWPVMALLVALSVPLSEWALASLRGHADALRQTLVTARLGLFTSVGAFLVCTMVALPLASWALQGALESHEYEPWWFDHGSCFIASRFVELRVQRHAASFSMVGLFLLSLLGFVALVFLPSLLRELRLAEPGDSALGRWLTAGYRAIERLVRFWGVLVALGAALVAALMLGAQLTSPDTVFGNAVAGGVAQVAQWSRDWLNAVVFAVAGGAAGLMAAGKVAIKEIQALRAPLDAALDVDNHFREFPREAINRVRIVERYVALLDHLRRQGYARLVIVAHSQGTVITAELLRYLQQRGRLQPGAAVPGQVDPEQLRAWLDQTGPYLLTVGSPLRQLYGLRFPVLYEWMDRAVQRGDGATWRGPLPHELGLARWSNLWGSGDYVGRWLWAQPDGTRPVPLQVDAARYEGRPALGQDEQGRRWKDVCIGADAHTHYFELGQPAVAAELLELARAAR